MKNNVHSVTCPQETRTQNHRKRLKKWWSSKAWKAHVAEKTAGKECAVCGCKAGQVKGGRKPAVLTINHLYRTLYNSLEEYLKFETDKVEVTCTTCNWMFEKGMDVCQVCKSDTVAKYKHFRQPMCHACFLDKHPDIKESITKGKEEMKALKKKLAHQSKLRNCNYTGNCGQEITFPNERNCGKCEWLGSLKRAPSREQWIKSLHVRENKGNDPA